MVKEITKLNKISGILAIFTFAFFGAFVCNTVNASDVSLSFSNEYIDYNNNTLEISVVINSGKSINASDSVIKFDQSVLEISSISTEESVFDLWMRYPKYSKQAGGIYFAGGNTEGFVGKGELFSIKFKIKNIDRLNNVKLYFDKSRILAHDGKGTNIITKAPTKTINKQEFAISSIK